MGRAWPKASQSSGSNSGSYSVFLPPPGLESWIDGLAHAGVQKTFWGRGVRNSQVEGKSSGPGQGPGSSPYFCFSVRTWVNLFLSRFLKSATTLGSKVVCA